MADGLDIVAVGIEDEGAVIVGMIMRPDARRAVVSAACRDRRAIKGVDGGPVRRCEGDVDMIAERSARADPEFRLAGRPEAGGAFAAGLLPRDLHDQSRAE